ncbi:GDSL-type esterase/lipase family protein [uncultured Draconibacterium sp.]|uniref:GDSL-type esterase/lipase family protein n=1 Tax=uncultured Draconibacterium sp. TaxID=1573823 RepID=UPI0029C7981A|nr:GDSL-type esterase/lipase family protein [uncultured Draconibacterium sp.]
MEKKVKSTELRATSFEISVISNVVRDLFQRSFRLQVASYKWFINLVLQSLFNLHQSPKARSSQLVARSFSLFGLALILLIGTSVSAQQNSYFYHVNQYNFVRYDRNEMHYPGDRTNAERFYAKLEQLVNTGEGRVNIVQIGGSHIQAGSFSGQMRNRFQQLNGEMNAGWGFMFPYRMARTNSPFGYYIRYNGYWKTFRNVEGRKSGTLGVGGISATTSSPKAELTILLEDENELDYGFNKLRIYYENTAKNYTLNIDQDLVKNKVEADGYTDIELNEWVDSLQITLEKDYNSQGNFTLLGMTTESNPNGIMYHSIGVNGAHVPAFLRCQLFTDQLADLSPDLVILGLGINDAYGRKFSQARFEDHYDQLITKIKAAAPNALIVFTTNNDSYMYRRYVNKNGEKVKDSMFKMAKKYNAGVWDMFSVMGGLNSIVLWQKNGLAQSDKIHFTREGYLMIADLFFGALMKDFENFLIDKKEITINSYFEDGGEEGSFEGQITQSLTPSK